MISTHILDTSIGQPAAGIEVTLEKFESGSWKELASEKTNLDGRIAYAIERSVGDYRLIFKIERYLLEKAGACFFLNTPIAFRISDLNRKYHIPLLLSHYGLSTYRGS